MGSCTCNKLACNVEISSPECFSSPGNHFHYKLDLGYLSFVQFYITVFASLFLVENIFKSLMQNRILRQFCY